MADVFADWSFEAERRDDGWYFLARRRKGDEDGAHWGPYIDEHHAFDQGYCDFQAWAKGPAMEAHSGERAKPVASGSSLLEFEVVQHTDPRA